MSKQEDKLFNALCNFFNPVDLYRNWRPQHLNSPSTGKNLEIDIYVSRFNVGIEFQGGVHFKDIKRYNNDSDSSRKNDFIKGEIVLNKKRTLSLVEIFPTDLDGDIIHNIKHRINNTIEFYFNREKYLKARSLELFRMYLDYNHKVPGIIPGHSNLYDQIKGKQLPLCYRFIKALSRVNATNREMRPMLFTPCQKSCDCNISVFNRLFNHHHNGERIS